MRNKLFDVFGATFVSWAIAACGKASPNASTVKLRDLTRSEAEADFDQMVAAFRSFYAPLDYKENRFGFELDDISKKYREKIAQVDGDAATVGILKMFLREFNDPHVELIPTIGPSGAARYTLALRLERIGDEVVVSQIGEGAAASGIVVGDALIGIDGQVGRELLATVRKYETFGNEVSDRHLAQFLADRPFYIPELWPHAEEAQVEFERPNGTRYHANLSWRARQTRSPLLEFPRQRAAEISFAGRTDQVLAAGSDEGGVEIGPFFASKAAVESFGFEPFAVDEPVRLRFGALKEDLASIYAVTYAYNGKRILLIRQPTYKLANWRSRIKAYKAILDSARGRVDALVVDQTRNPGGSVVYAEAFARLFVRQQSPGAVFRLHPDRRWVRELEDWALDLDSTLQSEASREMAVTAKKVEDAYDARSALAVPRPLGTARLLTPDTEFNWPKPFLVLIDEMAGSSADLFATLIKCSGSGRLFGRRTMGGGGTVEVVSQLSNSALSVALTRSLFGPSQDLPSACSQLPEIENNGVLPDYEHSYSRQDLASGYLGYVKAFSDIVISLSPEGHQTGRPPPSL